MTKERLKLGKRGETLARKRIESLGYKCLIKNYRCPLGEIDIIARDGETLVFIEIKTRKAKSIAFAKEAIDNRKRRQVSKVALAYMQENNCIDVQSRFDVVAINIKHGVEEIEVIKNAFELAF